MPKIERQSPMAPKPTTAGIMGRIKPVSEIGGKGIKVSIYGRPKTGKTRLMATFPKPMLIVGAEDGTASIRNVKGVDFIKINTTAEYNELISSDLTSYASIGLDTAGAFQGIVYKEILKLDEVPVQKRAMAMSKDQNSAYSSQTKSAIAELLKFHDQGKNIIIAAHERNHTEESNGGDYLRPSMGSDVSKAVAVWMNGVFDYVCHTFIREEAIEQKVTVNGVDVVTHATTGKKEFCLRVGPHEIFSTGFRVNVGAELPDVITDPSYGKIMKVIRGEKV